MMDMLFVRDYSVFQGGHLKVLAYLNHTLASGVVRPRLFLTPRSRAIAGNIFKAFEGEIVDEIGPSTAYFIAGEDWFILDAAGISTHSAPAINLIQGFRYADPKHPLFATLSRPALRICVSDALAADVRPHANGEVHVVKMGIETDAAEPHPGAHTVDVAIAGLKAPALARELAERVAFGLSVDPIVEPIPRRTFLERIARARVSVCLPIAREGFFLPPLEAMALGSAVVTADCFGNRGYCRDGYNCLVVPPDVDALSSAVLALGSDAALRARLVAGGYETAAGHSMEQERLAYHRLLGAYLAGQSWKSPV
jgi:hypothetical protein